MRTGGDCDNNNLSLKNLLLASAVLLICLSCGKHSFSQAKSDIARIEFNSGTRAYRQQVIVTRDSLISIEEDFRINQQPVVKSRALSISDWNNLMLALQHVSLKEIPSLKAPTDKRTYDAAAHGSIIITTRGNKTYTHGFDNEDPNEKLVRLVKQIASLRDSL